jgi:hypothetical protein
MTGPAPPPRRRRILRTALAAAALLSLLGFGSALIWANTYPRGPLFDPIAQLPDPLPAADAEVNARRISVAFADTQEMWARRFARAGGRGYRSAKLLLFTRGTGSPCAAGTVTAGPFYCADAGGAAFDLLFFEALSRRLRREAELGSALVVAHIVGAHVHGQLLASPAGQPSAERARGGVLAADCLAGVWAREGRIGAVPPGFYGRLIQTARNTAGDLARIGPEISDDLDPFRPGRIADREVAFQTGYTTGEPALCGIAGTLAAAG